MSRGIFEFPSIFFSFITMDFWGSRGVRLLRICYTDLEKGMAGITFTLVSSCIFMVSQGEVLFIFSRFIFVLVKI